MSDVIGPVYIQQPQCYAMQSRIDEEASILNLTTSYYFDSIYSCLVLFYFILRNSYFIEEKKFHLDLNFSLVKVDKLLRVAYDRVKALLKKVCKIK